MPEINIMGVVEYDGTDFEGFQIQTEDHRTVQGEIKRALEKILGHPVKLNGASRTDAGVHATGQVVAFKTSTSRTLKNLIRGVNSVSAKDWSFVEMAEMPIDFHPRHDATGKTYIYIIDQDDSVLRKRFSWGIKDKLDLSAIEKGAHVLLGEHDFKSFTTESAHRDDVTIRRIDDISIKRTGNVIAIEITGSGFLYQMVRRIIAVLVALGKGDTQVEDIEDLLLNPRFNGTGDAAPAKGLILNRVYYNDETDGKKT